MWQEGHPQVCPGQGLTVHTSVRLCQLMMGSPLPEGRREHFFWTHLGEALQAVRRQAQTKTPQPQGLPWPLTRLGKRGPWRNGCLVVGWGGVGGGPLWAQTQGEGITSFLTCTEHVLAPNQSVF